MLMISEKERLSALYSYAVLDTEQEAAFDNIVLLASQICNTPVSLISLIDQDRQWFKAKQGFTLSETPRSVSFCDHAILQKGVMCINDATKDERFSDNPLVTGDPHIRFYAGAPLVTSEGYAFGTLCVIDQQARQLSEEQLFALQTLSQQVVSQLELRHKNKQLEALLQSKDKIVSIISHDVKGPIRNSKQLIEFFAAGDVPYEDMKKLSGELLKSFDKADALLTDLLNWFLSIGSGVETFTDVDVSLLLNNVVETNSHQLLSKNNQVFLSIQPGLTTTANANMLKFIFRNLLLNANKFTTNGSISLTAYKLENELQVSVKDNGIGIAESRLKNLFKGGKEVSTPGTANEQGHGLGLLLVHEFVQKHKGTIEILSEVGIGTEVILSLPHNNKDTTPDPDFQENMVLV